MRSVFLKEIHKEEINELKSNAEERFENCLEILKKKNHDYSGDRDELFNFKLVEQLGILSTEKGILVRMVDKISRLSTLLDKEAHVADESIQDTLDDLINYAVILGYCLERRYDDGHNKRSNKR